MTPAATDLRSRAARLDALLRALDERPDDATRATVQEIVGVLLEMHRAGFERVVSLAGDAALGGPALVGRLADDDLLGPLLLIHGAHPYPVETRLARALERLRPQLAAHGCRATLVAVEDGAARVRLEGGARLSGRSDLSQMIETALLDVAPELTRVRIDTASAVPAAPPPLIQIERTAPVAPHGEGRP